MEPCITDFQLFFFPNKHFKATNFPLKTVLTASHVFWYCVFIIVQRKTIQIPHRIFDFQINSIVVKEYILFDLISEHFKICIIASR